MRQGRLLLVGILLVAIVVAEPTLSRCTLLRRRDGVVGRVGGHVPRPEHDRAATAARHPHLTDGTVIRGDVDGWALAGKVLPDPAGAP